MRCTAAVCSVILVALTGCASYTPSSVPIPKADAMPAWRTEGTVAAGADLYAQQDRLKTVFGANLRDLAVFPIQLLVENRGDRRQAVRRSGGLTSF